MTHEGLSSTVEVMVLNAHDIDSAAAQTGHSNPDIRQDWRKRAEAGGLVMFAIKTGGNFIASVNLLLDGADEQAVKAEVGIVPMINALGVNEEFRKQGLGSKLMDACEAYVRNHPELPQLIVLGVEEDNHVARRIYEERGYKYQKVNGEDLYDSSWPEIGEDGARRMYHARCYLMEKIL